MYSLRSPQEFSGCCRHDRPASEIEERVSGVPVDFEPTPAHTDASEFPASFSNMRLREAIRNNSVTFPSQTAEIRSLVDGDVRWRISHLYFVSGWPVRRICVRYRLSRQVVHNLLNQWRLRAVAAGLVQEIQPCSRENPAAQAGSAVLLTGLIH